MVATATATASASAPAAGGRQLRAASMASWWPLRRSLLRLELANSSDGGDDGGFNMLYLLPIIGGALVVAVAVVWLLRRRGCRCHCSIESGGGDRAKRSDVCDMEAPGIGARVAAFAAQQSSSSFEGDSGSAFYIAATDSQRTAGSSMCTGSTRGSKGLSIADALLVDSELVATAEADALYATLQRDPFLAGRRVSFDKIAFDRLLRLSPTRQVWLCQYEGDELEVRQLVLVSPPAPRESSGGDQPTSPEKPASTQPNASSYQQLERFVAEIQLMASLEHPNVLRLLGVAWTGLRNVSAVTEHCERGDLRSLLRRFRRDSSFSWRQRKVPIARGVARGLLYLHSRSEPVLYQSLRALTVAVTDGWDPVLCEFAAAVGAANTPAELLAAGGGDAYWLAPEVLSGEPVTPASDVFAFGVLVAELDAGGKPPYRNIRSPDDGERMRPYQVLHLVANGSLRPRLRADCPASVRALVAACLAQSPAQRPSAAQLVDMLTD